MRSLAGNRHLGILEIAKWVVVKTKVPLFLGTLNTRCRIIIRTQKRTIILTTTQMKNQAPQELAAGSQKRHRKATPLLNPNLEQTTRQRKTKNSADWFKCCIYDATLNRSFVRKRLHAANSQKSNFLILLDPERHAS